MQQQHTTVRPAGAGSASYDPNGETWQDPNNITADDGSYSYVGFFTPGKGGAALTASQFSFDLPANAVIDGIAVYVDGSQTGAYGSINLGSDSKDILGFNGTYGGSNDKWGQEWTAADINDTNFGPSIFAGDVSGGDGYAQVDYVEVTVYWHFSMDVEPAEVDLHHDYKVYGPDGAYLGNLPNVVSPYKTTQDMNSAGAQLAIEVAGTPEGQQPLMALGNLIRWLQGDWAYRQRIIIPSSKASADLTGFVALLDLGDLPTRFWQNVDSAGEDIRITDSYGVQELPFELVDFDQGTRTGRIWFRANSISSLYDNVFYLYFGSPTATAPAATDPNGRNAVWGDYAGVYHLAANANDSTANGANGTASGSPTHGAAKIGDGIVLDGTNDYVDFGGSTGIMDTLMAGKTDFQISFWAKYPSAQAGWSSFIGVNGSDTSNKLLIGCDNNSGVLVVNGITGPGGYIADDEWHYIVYTKAGTTVSLYIDGVIAGTTATQSVTLASGDFWSFGAERDAGPVVNDFVAGTFDELRVRIGYTSIAARAAEFANQNDPSTFYEFGAIESATIENMDGTLIRNGNHVRVYETSYYHPNGKLMYRGQMQRVEGEFSPSIKGTIKILCHSDGRDLDNMIARGAPFSYTNDQQQNSQDAYHTISTNKGQWEQAGQSWTVGAGVTNLGRIQLYLLGNATVTVEIYNWPNGNFGGFLGSVTRNVNNGSAALTDFVLPDFITVTAGQVLFMRISVNDGQSMRVYYKNNTNPYGNGAMYTSSYAGGSGGGSFVEQTGDDIYFRTASATPSTNATYTSQDPTTGMLAPIMDDYLLRGGKISYVPDELEPTGLSLTITFKVNTIYEAIEKIQQMSPAGWYWYVDLGTNELVFKRMATTPDWVLVKGRHIESLTLALSIENVVNEVLFSGGDTGGGNNLYINRFDGTSKALYETRLERKSDNRVTIQATGERMVQSLMEEQKGEQQYTTASILARTGIDITLIKPGQTVAFRGYGSYIDNMLLQITRLEYEAARARLQLGTLPIRFNASYEQVVRGLLAEQTLANPGTPS